jgi:hypothetical protein
MCSFLCSTAKNLRAPKHHENGSMDEGASSWIRLLLSTVIIIPCNELFGFEMDQVELWLAL